MMVTLFFVPDYNS